MIRPTKPMTPGDRDAHSGEPRSQQEHLAAEASNVQPQRHRAFVPRHQQVEPPRLHQHHRQPDRQRHEGADEGGNMQGEGPQDQQRR